MVTVRLPAPLCWITIRIAVEPEKRQSLTFCGIVDVVRWYAVVIASLALCPCCSAAAHPASRLRVA